MTGASTVLLRTKAPSFTGPTIFGNCTEPSFCWKMGVQASARGKTTADAMVKKDRARIIKDDVNVIFVMKDVTVKMVTGRKVTGGKEQ